jgi:hypothetical protein
VRRAGLAGLLAGAGLTGCDDLARGSRLRACGAEEPGNRVTGQRETTTSELVRTFGLHPTSYPELLAERPIFVVSYQGPTTVPELRDGRIINFIRQSPTCVWFNETEVRFYGEGFIDGD